MRDFSDDTQMLCLNTATLGHNVEKHGAGWTPEQVVDACAEKGFGGIVFWTRELNKDAHTIGNYARSAGLATPGLCRSPFLIGPLAASRRSDAIKSFRQSIELCSELGADALTVCVGGVADSSNDLRSSLNQVSDILGNTIDFAQQAGVKLALEPMHPVYAGNRSCLVTVRDTIDLIAGLDNHPIFGLALDVYHIWWDLTLHSELQRVKPNQILSFHLCDWLADTQDVLLDRGMMGDGVANLRNIRQAVENAGYSGFCEVEVFSANHWWKQAPEKVLAECVSRFKAYC